MPTQHESTRRQILALLKRRGEMTTAQLAEVIGITSMGVRQHLNGLERDDLVTIVVARQKHRMFFKWWQMILCPSWPEVQPESEIAVQLISAKVGHKCAHEVLELKNFVFDVFTLFNIFTC